MVVIFIVFFKSARVSEIHKSSGREFHDFAPLYVNDCLYFSQLVFGIHKLPTLDERVSIE